MWQYKSDPGPVQQVPTAVVGPSMAAAQRAAQEAGAFAQGNRIFAAVVAPQHKGR